MSQQPQIQRYFNELSDLRRISGEARESIVSEAFKTLLKDLGRSKNLVFIPQYKLDTGSDRRYVDGALLYELRVPFGYWEAKDEADDLDHEIETKFRRGYPQDNIIFEDSREAILIQDRERVARCRVDDADALSDLLELFFRYERKEIADFRKAVEQFKTDLPAVLEQLRSMIETAEIQNPKFSKAAIKFLKHAQDTINPTVSAADVREMLIQHILTEEIFSQVFDNSDFHRQNNVAKELYALEATFFIGKVKHDTLAGLRPYYAAIKSAAALVSSHHEKQTFLKTIYEGFYKVYNKKAADRLGVVYTPNEIVRFMIESSEYLCQKHFGKSLIDRNVEILDPAVGTGTFITELIEHFRGQPTKLRYKYLEELHANEVAILPYYVANLNIESTYAAILGEYEEYKNLCFVDTLDNVSALRALRGHHFGDLFGSVSEENVERIKRQNKRKISIVIGNPPYNANQANENDNNKNREYPIIDERIKNTYIKASTAQKTKLYDMYARFFRWASDRIDANGIVAFITNRSFIESRTFDGFRKLIAEEFNEIYLVDLGGDVRVDPRLSGTRNNVFGIQTGVAISFLVKRDKVKGSKIYYSRRPQLETAEEKLSFLEQTRLDEIEFETIKPSAKNNWLNLSDNDFESLIPTANKETKQAKRKSHERAVFKLFTLGVVTARDDWVYDFDRKHLETKIKGLIKIYNSDLEKFGGKGDKSGKLSAKLSSGIKWTRAVKKDLANGVKYAFDAKKIVLANYRPFVSQWLYRDAHLNEMAYQTPLLFGDGSILNPAITVMGDSSGKPYFSFAVNRLPDLNFVSPGSGGTQTLARYVLNEQHQKVDNITDWALDQFRKHYETAATKKGAVPSKKSLTKSDIFYYVYGVLHDPVYREKYALNLRREFPRIPFYKDFFRWAAWGKELMDLHIDFESAKPWPVKRNKGPGAGESEAILRLDKEAGALQVDSKTLLTGFPASAWEYKLGNRSPVEWVIDQYKETQPRDPTIRAKYNNYKFDDHRERVIELILCATTVSVKTMEIVEAMKAEKQSR